MTTTWIKRQRGSLAKKALRGIARDGDVQRLATLLGAIGDYPLDWRKANDYWSLAKIAGPVLAALEVESVAVRKPLNLAAFGLEGAAPVPVRIEFPADDGVILPTFVEKGCWGAHEIAHFLEVARARGPLHLVDVGANVGLFTIQSVLALKAAGLPPLASAACFEPHPTIAAMLQRNLTSAGLTDTKVFVVALGDEPGAGVLLISDVNGGAHSLVGLEKVAGSVEVPIVRAQDVYPPADGAAFLKLDVQGFEPQVLAGLGAEWKSRFAGCMVELAPDAFRAARPDLQQGVLDFLSGFELKQRVAGAPEAITPISFDQLKTYLATVSGDWRTELDVLGVRPGA